jgi:hypothetical protein
MKEVHDAVDLEALVAAGGLEDGEVAGVGSAGGAWGLLGAGIRSEEKENQKRGEQTGETGGHEGMVVFYPDRCKGELAKLLGGWK